MTYRLFTALAASLLLSLGALSALAIPPDDFCEENPDSPLCGPVDPDGEFCDRFPNSPLCDPGEDPPVDPDPDPDPPIDPCDLVPTAPGCNEEPPVVEDPPAEPPAPSFSHELDGSARVKGNGFKVTEAYSLQMNFDTSTLIFSAMDADGTLYSGNLVAKGKKGKKFRLFLDDGSEDALSGDVAERAGTASGRAPGAVVGESSKLTLKLLDDGSVLLKVKSEVLVDGIGEVVFKARLTGAPAVQALQTSEARVAFVDNWRVQR
jgi:hypothetical protein